ncbi:MAG: FAD-dependent oxidoreductase [Brachybacterium sp.]|uniref:FAD-dependent oxidoreductase n=1 Tax=Brachybacterium sp. TaxID=1891286 RepID=UPI002649A16D|nr:FAD-dependent oxidoreductase [Brachybacterium sp.]MDN5687052.1 FAD-dependent oxidoreductase [Brachybacterium sp.]
MIDETLETDIAVLGGGLAGICAAIGAARQGRRVVLAQNRPVLGGNSSSEVRVWVCGATAHGIHLFARETGIMGELFVENQYRNPEGNPYYWDLLLLEKVRAEENITLLLNTDVTEVEADGPADARVIRSVRGWMSGSERRITLVAPTFIDCTGDGLVGYLAGAEYMTGREPRSQFGESWAPDEPDQNMLGSTILFYSKDIGRPSKFIAPPFAVDVAAAGIPEHRVIRQDMKGCAFWWIEWGGEMDVVHDNERIRDELQGVCYGLWDHIKNSGEFDAENLTLEWVGSVPGKREYRRFVGEHVLTQQDVLDQTEFDDRIGFGGWSIDLHPSGGVYATEPGSRHWHPDGNYHLPLRILFSKDVANLWMAGRDISASHVAFGSTRVMATCAVLGEAAGIGAALAQELGVGPSQLADEHVAQLRRAMVRADASVLGVPNDDPADLALQADVRASSTKTTLASTRSAGLVPLEHDLGLVLPVDPRLDGIDVLVDAERNTELRASLHATSKPQNYLPDVEVDTARVRVPAGRSWVHLPLSWEPETAQNGFVTLHATPGVAVHEGSWVEPGTVTMIHREMPEGERWTEQWRHWKETLHGSGICFRATAPTDAFRGEQVRGGYARPYGGPNMWVSASTSEDPQPWIELTWLEPVQIGRVEVIFDDDVNEDLINLHHHRTEAEVMPTLVRDARVEALVDGAWREVARVEGNRRRRWAATLDDPAMCESLRVVTENGGACATAQVIGVRGFA